MIRTISSWIEKRRQKSVVEPDSDLAEKTETTSTSDGVGYRPPNG